MRMNSAATVDARHFRGWLTSLLAVASLGAGAQEIRLVDAARAGDSTSVGTRR
jgi:hypothetical protein